MHLGDLQSDLTSIIDNGIQSFESYETKNDNSLVTNVDVAIENEIIKYLEKNFPGIDIISEENQSSHRATYRLNDKFAIIDPIDGTENFLFFGMIYGSAISIIYGNINYHLIYIPERKLLVSSETCIKTPICPPRVDLYSTSCFNSLECHKDPQSIRILGSSSFMFYQMLVGLVKSYTYCGKAKIWDYYTGLSLAVKFGIPVKLDGEIISKMPLNLPHKAKFSLWRE